MKTELEIYKKWKMHIYGLIIIIFVQSMTFPLLYMLLKEFAVQEFIHKVIMITVFIIYTSVDLYFLYNRIILLKQLLDEPPVKCTLEDIFLIPYKEDKKRRYSPFPIVRSIEDNKLYLAYDKYSLMDFTAKFNYSDRKNVYCALYRADGRPVRFGDVVDMYMLKSVNIPVSINKSKNTVKLKGRKLYFYHVNDKIEIHVFKDITFYKGAIDLDAGGR